MPDRLLVLDGIRDLGHEWHVAEVSVTSRSTLCPIVFSVTGVDRSAADARLPIYRSNPLLRATLTDTEKELNSLGSTGWPPCPFVPDLSPPASPLKGQWLVIPAISVIIARQDVNGIIDCLASILVQEEKKTS